MAGAGAVPWDLRQVRSQTAEPRALGGSQYLKLPACCPIASQEQQGVEPFPQGGPHHGEEPLEAVPPLAEGGSDGRRIPGRQGRRRRLPANW